jgi:hypothetical protein
MFSRAAYAVSADLKAHGPGEGPTTAARKAARVMVNRRETKVAQIRPTGTLRITIAATATTVRRAST